MREEQNEMEIDLLEIVYVLRKKLAVIILATVALGGAAGAYSYYLVAPQYESKAKIYVMTKTDSTLSMSDLNVSTGLTADYIELIKSRTVLEQVIDDLKLDMEYENLYKVITVTNPTDTRMLEITTKYTDPMMAKKITDKIVAASQKAIAKVMKTEKPSVVEKASYTGKKVYPSNVKFGMIGAVLGFLLSAGGIVVRHIMDDRIKTPEDIRKYLDLETLALIPNDMNGKPKKKTFMKKMSFK